VAAVEYNTDLFDRDTVARMMQHYQRLLEAMVTAPGKPIAALTLLDEVECYRQLVQWNHSDAAPPSRDLWPWQRLTAQGEQQPDSIALMDGLQQLSFGSLLDRSERLAAYLQTLGVAPEVRVGVCLERGADAVLAVLAIWRAGGVYVPLDPDYPSERVRLLLEDCQPDVIITLDSIEQRLLAPIVATLGAHPVCLALDARLWSRLPQRAAIEPNLHWDNLAYIIYTSGSTGRPKGVEISCGALSSLLGGLENYGIAACGKRFLQFSSLIFDASILELGMLLEGAGLLIVPGEARPSGALLEAFINQYSAEAALLPPSLIAHLDPERVKGLQQLLVGGETLDPVQAGRWQARRTMVNAYGPTETTVCATLSTIAGREASIPIGRGIGSSDCYVLDEYGQLLPQGVVGELYVAGGQLARGYGGRPGLTAERFIPHPFSGEEGARLYRTGDRVCFRADGKLVFHGRADQQIKLRGFRIELGEIEAQLAHCAQVKQAAAFVYKEVIETAIVPCDTEVDWQELAQQIKAEVSTRLPMHMVPSRINLLSELPINSQGKIDRMALAALEVDCSDAKSLPDNPAEQRLALIWQQLLGCDTVYREDN
ncbi:non-ribosomal peptide synthetase, partial [Microbulbifer sp. 2201CG32-9]|uniref:non-ribosomal peptide synthetase n=1 Tax=Microbulbifer sp. 2201CG32-9 TaxID=3232309 RepID=UPI00345BCD7B